MSFPLPRSLPRTVLRSYGTVQGPAGAASLASRIPNALIEATTATAPRTTWTKEEVSQVYNTPLNQLTYASVRKSPSLSSSCTPQLHTANYII